MNALDNNLDSSIESFFQNIERPASIYSPIPFWFLNDDLKLEECERQLTDFKSKGIDGVILHPRIGIPNSLSYLSSSFLEIIEGIIKKAYSLNMHVVLYDEGMYPSGSCHGEVVKENPEFAAKGIRLSHIEDGIRTIAKINQDTYIVEDYTHGTIRGIHFGEDDGENPPLAANLLDSRAVSSFIRKTHDVYYEKLKSYFGRTIIGIFTDEPSILGRNVYGYIPWSDSIKADLVEKGIAPCDLVSVLKGETNHISKSYWKSVKKQLNLTYYKPLSDWCRNHDIYLMGHPAESDDVEELTYFSIPGQDLIFRMVEPNEPQFINQNQVLGKCPADLSRHLNRRRNSNEFLGVCHRKDHSWHLPAGDIKWYIDWLSVRGVNLLIPHAFYYSLRGERKNERPPDVGPHSILWPHYQKFVTYMKRLSFLTTDAKNYAQVAVLCQSQDVPFTEIKSFEENQIEYNYVARFLVKNQEGKSGSTLNISNYSYPYYLSSQNETYPGQQITSISHIRNRHFIASNFYPNLRLIHLDKDGFEYYLFTNEGEESLDVAAKIKNSQNKEGLFIDLWRGEIKTSPKFNRVENDYYSKVNFTINRRESLLLILIDSHEYTRILSNLDLRTEVQTNPIKADFNLIHDDSCSFIKTYEAFLHCDTSENTDLCLEINGREMLELYVNNQLVDVSFWNPHVLRIPNDFLRKENTLKIKAYGSTACQMDPEFLRTYNYGIDTQ